MTRPYIDATAQNLIDQAALNPPSPNDVDARFAWRLAIEVRSCQAALKKFAEELVLNPGYALQWSNDSFQRGARLFLFADLFARIVDEEGKVVPEAAERTRRRAVLECLRIASDPPRSTSPASNLFAQEMGAAWAEVARMLDAEDEMALRKA